MPLCREWVAKLTEAKGKYNTTGVGIVSVDLFSIEALKVRPWMLPRYGCCLRISWYGCCLGMDVASESVGIDVALESVGMDVASESVGMDVALNQAYLRGR